jgi:hypothetical protein
MFILLLLLHNTTPHSCGRNGNEGTADRLSSVVSRTAKFERLPGVITNAKFMFTYCSDTHVLLHD